MPGRSLILTIFLLMSVAGWSQVKVKDSQFQHGVYAEYSYISNDAGFTGLKVGAVNSGKAGVEFNAYKWLAASAEVAIGKGQVTNASSTTYTVLLGPRIFFALPLFPGIRPFAEAMGGGTVVNIPKSVDALKSSTSGTVSFGGGADVRLVQHIWWRGQIGYLYNGDITHINAEVQNVPNPPAWHLQMSTGPLLRF